MPPTWGHWQNRTGLLSWRSGQPRVTGLTKLIYREMGKGVPRGPCSLRVIGFPRSVPTWWIFCRWFCTLPALCPGHIPARGRPYFLLPVWRRPPYQTFGGHFLPGLWNQRWGLAACLFPEPNFPFENHGSLVKFLSSPAQRCLVWCPSGWVVRSQCHPLLQAVQGAGNFFFFF